MPRALRPRARRPARRRRRRRRHALDQRLPARARRDPRAGGTDPGGGARAPRGLRADRHGRCRLPDVAEVGRRAERARPARRDRERGRGRARDDQGSLRDGAAAATHARRAGRSDALLRDGPGLHLPPRGVRHRSRAPAGGDRSARRPGRARRRCRRVHLRRGDGDARVDGGPARNAAAEAAVPEPVRLPRPADADQQRRDARPRRAHPPWRLAASPSLVGHRRRREAGLLRGAARHHAPRT